MSQHLNYLYHPFPNSSFGYLFAHEIDMANVTKGEIVDEIDLYYQPLEKPSIVLTFFFVKSLIICVGEAIGIKLIESLKKENGLLTDVTKVFIIGQMIFHPILLCLDFVVNTIHPVNEIIGNWFCFFTWLLWGVSMRIGVNNSFISALMRYLFIVHETKVNDYGKEKVKRWFLYFCLATPIIQFTLQALEGSPRLSFIKKCYGIDHRVFLIETSTLNVFKGKFLKLDGNFVDFDNLRDIGLQICKFLEAISFLIMGFNITETFFYYKIVRKIER